MRLTDRQIAKYQDIYLETFGEAVSKEVALVQGLALVRLVKCLSKPEEKYENDKVDQPARED